MECLLPVLHWYMAHGIVIDSWPKNLNRNAALHVGLCFAASWLQKVCLNANYLKIMFQSCAICASNCFATRMWLQGHFRQSALCPLYAFVPLHDGTGFQKCTAFKKSAKVCSFECTRIRMQDVAPNQGQKPHIKSNKAEDLRMTPLETQGGFRHPPVHLRVVSRVSMLDWFQLNVHGFVATSRSEEC